MIKAMWDVIFTSSWMKLSTSSTSITKMPRIHCVRVCFPAAGPGPLRQSTPGRWGRGKPDGTGADERPAVPSPMFRRSAWSWRRSRIVRVTELASPTDTTRASPEPWNWLAAFVDGAVPTVIATCFGLITLV